MTRLILPTVFLTLFAGAAFAQTTPPPVQTPPPAQTPKPTPAPALPVTPPAATPVPFPTESKVGFVDMQAIVSASKLGKSGQDKMKALQTQRDTDLSAKSKAAQQLSQEIQAQAGVLTPTVLAQKNSELDKLTRAGQFAQQDWDAQVDALNKQLLQDFQEKVLPILESLRAEMGLFAIFDAANSGALAIHPGLNLSTEVIKRLDAKYPSGK